MQKTVIAALAFIVASGAFAGAQEPHQATGTAQHKKVETQAELRKEAKIAMTEARALARKTVPKGKITSSEIEREGGKLIYSFDMKVPGTSGIEEVNVDAMTGALVNQEHETPKDEKAEAKAARAARAKP